MVKQKSGSYLDFPILPESQIYDLPALKNVFNQFLAKRREEGEEVGHSLDIFGAKQEIVNGERKVREAQWKYIARCSTNQKWMEKFRDKEFKSNRELTKYIREDGKEYFGCIIQPVLSSGQIKKFHKIQRLCKAQAPDDNKTYYDCLKKEVENDPGLKEIIKIQR